MDEHFRMDHRTTFDPVAEQYDAVRPGYPDALIDDLVSVSGVPPGGRILEIGCGPGKATISFAQRGFAMLCIDISENMIRVARRNLGSFPCVAFWQGAFEDWTVERGAFDLVFAAQAIHWIDFAVRFHRPHQALRPGGSLALVWNYFDGIENEFTRATQLLYRRHAPEMSGPEIGRTVDERVSAQIADIDASGLFGPVEVRRIPWSRSLSRDDYLRLIDTYSDHRAIEPDRRRRLFGGIGEVIDSMGGTVLQPYQAVFLHTRSLAD